LENSRAVPLEYDPHICLGIFALEKKGGTQASPDATDIILNSRDLPKCSTSLSCEIGLGRTTDPRV
jgi:hypothetical protein